MSYPKKSFCLILVLSLLLPLCLCGCAKKAAAPETVPSPAPSAAPLPSVASAPEEQTEEAAAPEEAPEEPPVEVEVTPEPQTPKERAAALGLPEPPELDINSWEFLYAAMSNGVGRYHPPVANFEDQYIDKRIFEPTLAFITDARAQGYQVWIGVAYRNFEYNMYAYENALAQYGSAYEAAKHVTPPGCSEHSTGLAFDITDEMMYAANYYDMHDETVADTEVYKWMAEHCTDYGFIVRYPEGKEDVYERGCYAGHFRYVGVEAAKYITENGLCLEEFFDLYGKVY